MGSKKFIIVIVLLLITFAAVQILTRLETVDNFALQPEAFPESFNGWVGTDVAVDEREREFLPDDTLFVKKYYQKPGVGGVYLVIVFSGKDRRSIHRPEVCYPSQGWSIVDKSIFPVAVDHSIETLNTARLDITFGKKMYSHSEIVLYWFMGNKRITASHWKRVLLMAFDRCFRAQNFRWAFIRISTNTTQKNQEETLSLLSSFIQDLFPLITAEQYKQY